MEPLHSNSSLAPPPHAEHPAVGWHSVAMETPLDILKVVSDKSVMTAVR